jgi:hypothetical protein
MAAAIPVVESIAQEDALISSCRCGGVWALAAEDVVPLDGRWFDCLVLRCRSCGQHGSGVFDVTAFFEPRPRVWATYRGSSS